MILDEVCYGEEGNLRFEWCIVALTGSITDALLPSSIVANVVLL
jgi:hypothetical protein